MHISMATEKGGFHLYRYPVYWKQISHILPYIYINTFSNYSTKEKDEK